MKHTYKAAAVNSQGCGIAVGIDMEYTNGGKPFSSIEDAARTARRELASGWKVSILDETGTLVKSFTIR